jgi:hypothetical protein
VEVAQRRAGLAQIGRHGDRSEIHGGLIVRCTFTGVLDVTTACAILDGCGGLSRVCL